jgi:hypothetical protein
MNSEMTPDLYIVLRNTSVNGVLVEKDRYIQSFGKHVYATAYVEHANNVVSNANRELKGIDVLYFIKPVELA